MVLLKLKGLEYPLQCIAQIMDTHSHDGLLSCILYTKHLLFSPFRCYDSTRMLISSDLALALPQLDQYPCTGFPLYVRLSAEPHPDFGFYVFSKDTSSVEKEN
jgi:hypothetical protein